MNVKLQIMGTDIRQSTDAHQVADACCPINGSELDESTARTIAAIAKVLSDPVRLRVYHFIASNKCCGVCSCHMPEAFGISQPTLSHHLKKLVQAGLVLREQRGKWAYFSATKTGLAELQEFLGFLPKGEKQ